MTMRTRSYRDSLRLTTPASPTKPMPNSVKEAGSGVGVVQAVFPEVKVVGLFFPAAFEPIIPVHPLVPIAATFAPKMMPSVLATSSAETVVLFTVNVRVLVFGVQPFGPLVQIK